MTNNTKPGAIDSTDAERAMKHHLESICRSRSRKPVREFVADLEKSSHGEARCLILDEANVLRWMIGDVAGRSLMKARRRLGAVSRFVNDLTRAGLLDMDPIQQFRSAFARRGWVHIIPALQAADPKLALAALRSHGTPPGPLAAHSKSYLAFQRGLGKKYDQDRGTLRALDRFLQARCVTSLDCVTPALIESWFDSMPGNWTTRLVKARCADRCFSHLVTLGILVRNPVPRLMLSSRRGVPRTRPPFIFTTEQMATILAEVLLFPSDGYSPWHVRTCHTMIVLLYGLGLRHGEARRLRVRDIDFARHTLFIEQTKFYKSRCLPFGPKIRRCLEEFVELRRGILPPMSADHPLFVAWRRRPVSGSMLGDTFRSIIRKLGIVGRHGRGPRLHDLRHSFAVDRLLRWYREGVDVHTRLPFLATFLGHVDIQSTEVYLTVTDDLLHEASFRFHEKFGRILENDRSHA